MHDRLQRVQGPADVGGDRTGDLAPVLDQLRDILGVLPAYVPDPGDGADWLEFDSALSDLYRAVLALDQVEHTRRSRRRAAVRGRRAPGGPPPRRREVPRRPAPPAAAGGPPPSAAPVATGAGTSR